MEVYKQLVRYVIKKILFMLLSLFVLASATFFLMKAIPGNPFQGEKNIPPAIEAKLMERYGFDKPIFQQYVNYIGNLLKLDLGTSMKQQYVTVESVIKNGFAYSLQLGLFAIIVSVVVGVLLGLIAALNHRKFLDGFTIFIAVLG